MTRRRPAGHPCDDLCTAAAGPADRCRCACGGRNHGRDHATPAQLAAARADVAGRGAFALLGLTVEDVEW